MFGLAVNGIALVFAVVAKLALGAVWYSRFAFGARDGARGRSLLALPVDVVATTVMALVLLRAIRFAGGYGALAGGAAGFWSWLGFIAVSALGGVLHQGRPVKPYLVDIGYWLVALVVMGAILGAGW